MPRDHDRTDEGFMRRYTKLMLEGQRKSREALRDGKASDAQKFATATAIFQDKRQALAGKPQEIVTNVHQVNLTALSARFGMKLPFPDSHQDSRQEAPLVDLTLPALPSTADGD